MSLSTESKPQSHTASNLAVALLKYRPKCDDELCLTTGQTVLVLSIDPKVSGSEGWWVGQDDFRKVGVFPANYVRLQVSGTDSYDKDIQQHCYSSEAQGSSFYDSMSSFSMDETAFANRVAAPFSLANSLPRTESEIDTEVHVCQNYKYGGLKESISNLRIIKFEDIVLGEAIGAGSFGTVYQGVWHEKTVALKVYHQTSNQIQREVLNLDQLAHRNVVEFFGVWETQETFSYLPALVMGFAHGGALHAVVRRRPAIRPVTLVDWALQIAEGMRYLHDCAGLVHRDLKTANILIREPLVASPGPDDLMDKTLVISDFGMSCPTDTVGSRVSGVGTAAYAAPEVICMDIFSLASDVWSYGVVLWETFTMLEPFKEFDRAQQLVNIGRYRRKLFIPRSDSGFPQVVGALLARCWADERTDRPNFCDICNYLLDAQYDAFFSLSVEEFATLQDVWIREIFDEAELSLLSESCSSEASSPLRRQNEHLQQENAEMRDALNALKRNVEHYRGTIAGLQKDNQILSVLVANTLYSNAAPAPRKKPLIYNPFRRNEQKTSVVNTLVEGKIALPGAGAVTTANRSPREVSLAIKLSGRRHGGQKTSKSTLNVSYPSDVRHVVHVPGNFIFESSNQLNPSAPKCNISPGNGNTLMDFSSPSCPANPVLSADGSTSSSSYLHPHMDNQSTYPFVRPSNFVFSPTDEAADIARHFAFLYTQNGLNGATPLVSQMPSQILQQQHHQRISKSDDTGGLTSYKSAPELCKQIGCSKARVNNLQGRHTVSRGSTFDSTGIPENHKHATSSTSSAHGSANTSKRHRIGLSALFHTSRSKHSSVPGRPSSPILEPVLLSPVPSQIPATSADLSSSSISSPPCPFAILPSGAASQPDRSSSKHKPTSTATRRLMLQKILQIDHSRQRRVSGGSRKSLDSIKKRRYSISPDSSTIPFEGTVQDNPSPENIKVTMEAPQSTCVPATTQIPPLPPSRLRESNQSEGPRRQLLDIMPPPPSRLPIASPPIPRPSTLSATSDGDTKNGVPHLKSLSLDVLYRPDETIAVEAKGKLNEGDVGKEIGGLALVNPLPLALWSALHVVSITPLLLNCNVEDPVRPYRSIASRSASFARVTFSPSTLDESDYESDVLGKPKSHLNRTSSPLALATTSIDRGRQHARRKLSARELSAPAPSSSLWQRNANQLPPVYYSPPPRKGGVGEGARRETCCNCGCHSVTGGSRQSSSAAIATTSEFSSPWLPVNNPVALSRDAYLKVTQDGYLNRLAVDETLDDGGIDMKNDSRPTSLALTPRSLRCFSPSTLFSPDYLLQQRQDHSSNSQHTYFFDSSCEPAEYEEVGGPSFGAGEAAEDTVTLHAEFQIPPQTLDNTVYESKEEADCRNGCPPIFHLAMQNPELVKVEAGTERFVKSSSYPCRRRKAFRLKGKPEGLLSSPEDEKANGPSDRSAGLATP